MDYTNKRRYVTEIDLDLAQKLDLAIPLGTRTRIITGLFTTLLTYFDKHGHIGMAAVGEGECRLTQERGEDD